MSGVIAIMVALLVSAAALAMDFSCGGFDDMTPWDTWDNSSSSVWTTPDDLPEPPSVSQAAWVQGVEISRDGAGYSLEVSFTLPDYCSRFDGHDLSVVESWIEVSLEIADLSDGGNVACAQAIQELSANIPIEAALRQGENYTVSVNGVLTNLFTTPEDPSVDVVTARSPVESVELLIMESYPPQYSLYIVSALPKGSSCSWFNGYDIGSPFPGRVEVEVTHHEVAELRVCTADYPIVETFVPLGADFEPGQEYEVVVNGELAERFEAQ